MPDFDQDASDAWEELSEQEEQHQERAIRREVNDTEQLESLLTMWERSRRGFAKKYT